jgi:hypothetical protein
MNGMRKHSLLPVLFVPTGTQGLNNFTIVEVSIAVKFFTETGLVALCSRENIPFATKS